MKRIFLSLSLVAAIGLSPAFANVEPDVNAKIKSSFEKEFSAAKFVSWTEDGEFLKATFLLGEHRAIAYFSEDGRLEGCARDLFYDQLPMLVMNSLDRKYAGAIVLDVTEIVNSEGASYKVNLEYKEKKYRVKTDAGGNIIESEKLK
jgi:hypothetical protein